MSRKRKQLRDALQRGENMLELEKPNGQVGEERTHTFTVQTQFGPAQTKVPHSQMKRCPCGCDRFAMQHHIGLGKPQGQIGGKPTMLKVDLLVCAECGKLFEATHPMVGDPKLVTE